MGRGNQKREIVYSCFCPALVDDFENLLDELAPSSKYMWHGRKMTRKIFDTLQQKCGSYDVRIDRTKLGGSLAKNTGIAYVDEHGEKINPDFDLVLFINDEDPPFDEILRVFQKILERLPQIGKIKKSKICLQFSCKTPVGDIDFDVLPAPNFVTDLGSNENVADVSREEASAHLRKQFKRKVHVDPEINKMYSTAFCEKSVALIKSFTNMPFYRNVVRLAKYWNSNIKMDMYISARSFMMELIAIDCQIGRSKKCIISGFRRFLEAVADFEDIYVEIGQKYVKQNDPYYRQVTKRRGPVIIDPANQYNNLAHDIDPKAITIFMSQATKTLEMLDEVRNNNDYENFEGEFEDVIDNIFSHK